MLLFHTFVEFGWGDEVGRAYEVVGGEVFRCCLSRMMHVGFHFDFQWQRGFCHT
jgi:hypothetical protein